MAENKPIGTVLVAGAGISGIKAAIELAETGYNFVSRIGTGWIAPFPDAWIGRLAAIARDQRVALFAREREMIDMPHM